MTAPSLAALRQALLRAADALPALAEPAAPADFDPRAARAFRITGVGSSAAHARYLAALLAEELGLPARFVPLDAFPLAGDARDVLVVFSQALSPNARLALADTGTWLRTVLVTGAATSRDAERRRTVDVLRDGGVIVVDSGVGDEFGTLLRVEGPVAGYVAALRFARSLGLARAPALDRVRNAYLAALERGVALAPTLAPRLAAGPVLLLASGSYREATDNLRLKLVEGLLRPVPPIWDPIEFAHGIFQSLVERRATFLALTRPDAPGEAELLARLRSMLDPERHPLVTLDGDAARLPRPLRARGLPRSARAALHWTRAGIDQVALGRGAARTRPLYELRAEVRSTPASPAGLERRSRRSRGRSSSARSPPARRLASCRSARPSSTARTCRSPPTRWIADALAERFCARVPTRGAAAGAARSAARASTWRSPARSTSTRRRSRPCWPTSCASLARHGFERPFVLLRARRQRGALLRDAAPRWQAPRRAARRLAVRRPRGADRARCSARAAALGVAAEAAGHHAGEIETSIVPALRPASAAPRRARAGPARHARRPAVALLPGSPRRTRRRRRSATRAPRAPAARRALPRRLGRRARRGVRGAKKRQYAKGTVQPVVELVRDAAQPPARVDAARG